jgi:biopolymer transport protein TolR
MTPSTPIGKRARKRLMSEINVVPYIDVMLVLLVIFMVTAPLLTEGVNVDLPKASGTPQTDETEPFVVHVNSDGRYFINDEEEPVENPTEIRIKAAAVVRRAPETRFLVRGDRRVPYETVVQAMSLLQEAGVPSIGLVTDFPEQ